MLRLSDSKVLSLDPLKELTGLKSLTLEVVSGSGASSLDAIKELKNLNHLALLFPNSGLGDLSFLLQSYENLETLQVLSSLPYQFSSLPKSLKRLELSDAR